MIQRRQTIYLLAVVILGIVLFFLPVLQFTTPDTSAIQRMFMLSACGLQEVATELDYGELPEVDLQGLWGLQVITLVIPLLALIDIFMYRHRLWQARLNIFAIVACLGYYAMLYTYIWSMRHIIYHVEWNICFASCLPLVCLVLLLGATRLILKDEMMVRAANRIR